MPQTETTTPTQQEENFSRTLVNLEPKSKYRSIPDILIKNAAYQKASVVESIDPDTAQATALEALVNIFCSYSTDLYNKTTTGTGFIIDTDGIILTNAHVAQFLLLEGLEGKAQCIIRTGNPAIATYEAELLYIPPAWVQEHANLVNEISPKGTGERDYALLYITSGLEGIPMPEEFPALPFDVSPLTLGTVDTQVFVTGYPAKSILENGIDLPLIPKQATTTVGELMTFGSNLIDVLTIRGSALGEHGSSGGPVVNSEGNAVGIISTKGDDEQFGDGSLRAISIAYINRTIKEETGSTLTQNLGGDLPYRAKLFKDTLVPFLQKTLENEL
jgi:S1-C subfamily serine protease